MKNKYIHKYKDKRALSICEAALYACVSRGTIENWMAQGLLPYEELPGRGKGMQKFRRIRVEDLKAFLEKHYCANTRVEQHSESEELILLPRKSK